MSLEVQIALALALDLAIGDPAWTMHPARLLGRAAAWLERVTRSVFSNARLAGVVTVTGTLSGAVAAGLVLIHAAGEIHPLAGDLASILILYTTFSARDLADHAMAVYRPLAEGDIAEARERVGRIVGRDTAQLDEAEVVRAATESVAENTVDGVTAPLFFAALLGPVGALAYKAVNTMDSMFGYRNERYAQFGQAAARLDDAANYLPARITGVAIALAAALVGMDGKRSAIVMARDGRNHASPNAGWAEAAFAGALGVRLGGGNVYQGTMRHAPAMGEARETLVREHIRSAVRLMYTTSLIAALLFIGARLLTIHFTF